MKLHFVSKSYAVPLAYQSKLRGCKVTVHLDAPIGTGLFPKLPSVEPPHHTNAVIFDGLGWGQVAEDMRKDGERVLFGGKWSEVLATRPDYQKRVLAEAGLIAPPEGAPEPPYALLVGG